MANEKEEKRLKASKKLRRKLDYLRKKCPSKGVYDVLWFGAIYEMPDIFLYGILIRYRDSITSTDLWKESTDYNYLIELYDLYMKDI